MKRYIAYADNGRDYTEFFFYSDHRANSKANVADAVREYKRKHGHRILILSTMRCPE